jgi:peptidoglycan/xylan/chitin deacetylase (PgdA/CDA1 family)
VLSGDFDKRISKEQCVRNVLKHCKNGSIIVFHDSLKAFERLEYALPKVLENLSKKGFEFRTL